MIGNDAFERNQPFTPDERSAISQQLDAFKADIESLIKEKHKQTQDLEADAVEHLHKQMQLLHEEIQDLKEQLPKMGRRHWSHWLMGTVLQAWISKAVDPETLRSFCTQISSIFNAPPMLPG